MQGHYKFPVRKGGARRVAKTQTYGLEQLIATLSRISNFTSTSNPCNCGDAPKDALNAAKTIPDIILDQDLASKFRRNPEEVLKLWLLLKPCFCFFPKHYLDCRALLGDDVSDENIRKEASDHYAKCFGTLSYINSAALNKLVYSDEEVFNNTAQVWVEQARYIYRGRSKRELKAWHKSFSLTATSFLAHHLISLSNTPRIISSWISIASSVGVSDASIAEAIVLLMRNLTVLYKYKLADVELARKGIIYCITILDMILKFGGQRIRRELNTNNVTIILYQAWSELLRVETKFGRPSNVSILGEVSPLQELTRIGYRVCNSFCEVLTLSEVGFEEEAVELFQKGIIATLIRTSELLTDGSIYSYNQIRIKDYLLVTMERIREVMSNTRIFQAVMRSIKRLSPLEERTLKTTPHLSPLWFGAIEYYIKRRMFRAYWKLIRSNCDNVSPNLMHLNQLLTSLLFFRV